VSESFLFERIRVSKPPLKAGEPQMTEINPLRGRMIEDMTVRSASNL
jgi:hypothetical protein